MLAEEEAAKPRKRIEDFMIPKSTDMMSIELFYALVDCVSIYLYTEKVHGKSVSWRGEAQQTVSGADQLDRIE